MKKKAEKLAFHYIFLIYGFEPYIGHVAMGFLNVCTFNLKISQPTKLTTH